MTLGELIKEYREKNNYSMQEFADRCNLSKGYISMLEKGQHPQSARPLVPSIETLNKIAIGMGTDLDTFVSAIDMDTLVTVNTSGEDKKIPTTESSGVHTNDIASNVKRLSPELLSNLTQFLELAKDNPDSAARFLSFAVQELQSSKQSH